MTRYFAGRFWRTGAEPFTVQPVHVVSARHSTPAPSAFDHLTLATRNLHDSGNAILMRNPLAILAASFDRLGRHETAATTGGFAFSPLHTARVNEINTTIAHLRDVLGDKTYELLARKGEAMTTGETAMIRLGPNRPGPNRTERCRSVRCSGRGMGMRHAVESQNYGIDTANASGRIVAGVLASLAELGLELGRERRAAAREARRARGQSVRRPRTLKSDKAALAPRMREAGEPVPVIAETLGSAAPRCIGRSQRADPRHSRVGVYRDRLWCRGPFICAAYGRPFDPWQHASQLPRTRRV
jgi:hypothetical protein